MNDNTWSCSGPASTAAAAPAVPAWLPVNCVSIVQAEAVDEVAYFHLELPTHDIILAEGQSFALGMTERGHGRMESA
jgi:hypothetical protein